MATQSVRWIKKNENEKIRIAMLDYRGSEFVDIRLFFKMRDKFLPTRKGIVIPMGLLKQVARILQEA